MAPKGFCELQASEEHYCGVPFPRTRLSRWEIVGIAGRRPSARPSRFFATAAFAQNDLSERALFSVFPVTPKGVLLSVIQSASKGPAFFSQLGYGEGTSF